MDRIFDFNSFCLNEAMRLPLENVKDELKKNDKTALLFKKGVKMSDIQDPKTFLDSVKNIFLNNVTVIDYVKKTEASGEMTTWELKKLRQLKPEQLNDDTLQDLLSFTKDFQKQVDKRGKKTLSTDARKAMSEWRNASRRKYIDTRLINELDNIPGLKPDKPIKIYRGLLWASKYSFEKDRDGRKFLDSIKKGTDFVEYQDDKPSSWTNALGTAEGFATAGPSSSQLSGTMNWLQSAASGDKIQGELGAIIMILAKPEDIIADLSRVESNIQSKFAAEGEVILREGKYTAKIVAMYDRKEGKVDPKTYFSKESKSVGDHQLKALEELKTGWYDEAVKLSNDIEAGAKKTGAHIYHSWLEDKIATPANVKVAISIKDEVLKVFTGLFDLVKKMDIAEKMDPKTASEDAREIMKFADTGFNYVTVGDRSDKKKFFEYESAKALVDAIRPFYGAKPGEVIAKQLKRDGTIKRDLKFYTADKQEAMLTKSYSDMLDAAGIKLPEDPKKIIEAGNNLTIEIGKIANQLYWIDKAKDFCYDVSKKKQAA